MYLHDGRDDFAEDVVDIPRTLVNGGLPCPELLNSSYQFLFGLGFHLGFKVEFQLVPYVFYRI